MSRGFDKVVDLLMKSLVDAVPVISGGPLTYEELLFIKQQTFDLSLFTIA